MRGLIVNSGASAQAAKLHPCQVKLSARACWSWRAALLSPAELRGAKGAPAIHQGPWPIRNGLNHQPTRDELRTLHRQDVTSDQAQEIDRSFSQSPKQILGQRPHPCLDGEARADGQAVAFF
jgi:hypothetical protein